MLGRQVEALDKRLGGVDGRLDLLEYASTALSREFNQFAADMRQRFRVLN